MAHVPCIIYTERSSDWGRIPRVYILSSSCYVSSRPTNLIEVSVNTFRRKVGNRRRAKLIPVTLLPILFSGVFFYNEIKLDTMGESNGLTESVVRILTSRKINPLPSHTVERRVAVVRFIFHLGRYCSVSFMTSIHIPSIIIKEFNIRRRKGATIITRKSILSVLLFINGMPT